MHGIIFTSFRDYVAAEFGDAAELRLFRDEPVYLLSEAYDDDRLTALVVRASELAGRPVDELLHDFGVFTAERTFARLYPAFFAVAESAREFVLTVETRIHELVRATVPNARPPQLHAAPLGPDRIEILYTSPRRLCVLLRGLVEGAARHYGETTEIEEPTCMRRGDVACRFRITFAPDAPPA